ncbi:MAG: tetratricopeptide repeat protein [Candidatus Sericytochromatia bacterium]
MRQARKQSDQLPLVREALALYREAVQLDAHISDPWLGIAYLIFSVGQKDRALAILKSAQKSFPADRRLIQLHLRLQRAQVPEQGELRPIARIESLRRLTTTQAPQPAEQAPQPAGQAAQSAEQAAQPAEQAPQPAGQAPQPADAKADDETGECDDDQVNKAEDKKNDALEANVFDFRLDR